MNEKKPNDTSHPQIEISKDGESQEKTKCFGLRTGEVEKENKADDLFSLLKKANSERAEYDSWKCKFCTNSFSKWVGLMVHARKVHEKNPIKWEQNITSNSPNIELPKADESKNSKKCGSQNKVFMEDAQNERNIDIRSVKQKENWEKTDFGAWKCKFCNNIFYKRSGLMAHMQAHVRRKPHS